MDPAPIALFVYNRPDHLRRTLSALQACPLSRESALYVFSDGPAARRDRAAVESVRGILKTAGGFERISVRTHSHNLGLAASIIAGVTELARTYGRVIVLEDDLIVAPGFLMFMNEALTRYEDDRRVMQVSGYMFPVQPPRALEETFFCRIPTSWGWGTWARAWERFNVDSAPIVKSLTTDPDRREAFDLHGAYPYFEHLAEQAKGKLDVWGVRWYASMFGAGGYCLYPGRSLVQNIGMDGSGMHCLPTSHFDVELTDANSWNFPDRIEESPAAFDAIRCFLSSLPKRSSGKVDLVSRLRTVTGKIRRAIIPMGSRESMRNG